MELGKLSQILKNNDEWILLDEINLGSDEMLLKLKTILEGEKIFLINSES